VLSHHKSIAVSKTIVGGKLEMENSNVLQEKKNPLTEGDIFPALIRFALPVLVDSGRKECPLRYGGAGFRFGRRETPEIFGCDYLAVEMDDGDISFPFISMR
jgi:hypothetical protein